MARAVKYHHKRNQYGWPLFTSNQTENRIALCRKALCPQRDLTLRFKDCYPSEQEIVKFCKLQFLSEEYFNENAKSIQEMGWGGCYKTPKSALEGAFYPFVRCIQRCRPIDTGIVWIGTKYEYPRIYVDNLVANWLCPYSEAGYVMSEPFEPLPRVLQNWSQLADRRRYPSLSLPPSPDL